MLGKLGYWVRVSVSCRRLSRNTNLEFGCGGGLNFYRVTL